MALAFDTRVPDSPWLAGSASEQIEGELLRLGCIMLDRHESFALEGPQGPLAEGEVRRALRWADEALENLELPGFSLIEHSITQPRWSQAGTLSEAVAAMR